MYSLSNGDKTLNTRFGGYFCACFTGE